MKFGFSRTALLSALISAVALALGVVWILATVLVRYGGPCPNGLHPGLTLHTSYRPKVHFDGENRTVQFKESRLAHRLLASLRGIEICASAQNPFGLDTLNVDRTEHNGTEAHRNGLKAPKVHIVAPADKLPFTNDSMHFVINSNVLHKLHDPIAAIQEWLRVVVPGGYVYMDIPHTATANRTTLAQLLERHGAAKQRNAEETGGQHWLWRPEDVLQLCAHFRWTVAEWQAEDDRTHSVEGPSLGFTIVLKKI